MAQREILTQYCFAIHKNSYHYKNVFKLQGFLCCCGSMGRTWATNVIIPTTYTYLCPNGTTLQLLGAEYSLNKSQNLRFLKKKNSLDCLVTVSQEKQTKKLKENNIKNPPHKNSPTTQWKTNEQNKAKQIQKKTNKQTQQNNPPKPQ